MPEIKKCLQCNKEYITKEKNSKYCSGACRGLSQRRRVKKVCEVCGKEFELINTYAKNRIYKTCSNECYGISRIKKKIEKVCEYCGSKFYVKHDKRSQQLRFCCVECCYKSKSKERVCKFCGKVFYVRNCDIKKGKDKYCSKKCFYDSCKNGEERKCKYCNKEFHISAANIKNRVGIYCSFECKMKDWKENHSPLWEGGYEVFYTKNLNNPQVRLNKRISSYINKSLKNNKNGRHWEDLVGYRLEELRKHLQSTMPEGYTWNDFMSCNLEIDHIIPISVFNFSQPEHIDFKRCWSLNNLRLLPAKENRLKGAKLLKPLQLALRV